MPGNILTKKKKNLTIDSAKQVGKLSDDPQSGDLFKGGAPAWGWWWYCINIFQIIIVCNMSPEPGANAKWQWGQVGWMFADHRDGPSSSSFFAWSSIAQLVCQQAFSLLEIGFQRPSGFESCIPQRKTTCLLSSRKSLACARASELTTTNSIIYYKFFFFYFITILYILNHFVIKNSIWNDWGWRVGNTHL